MKKKRNRKWLTKYLIIKLATITQQTDLTDKFIKNALYWKRIVWNAVKDLTQIKNAEVKLRDFKTLYDLTYNLNIKKFSKDRKLLKITLKQMFYFIVKLNESTINDDFIIMIKEDLNSSSIQKDAKFK